MELEEDGTTLDKFIKNSDTQDKEKFNKTAKHIIKEMLEGLQFIHERNICHRDIKPDNIMISSDGAKVKIFDFN